MFKIKYILIFLTLFLVNKSIFTQEYLLFTNKNIVVLGSSTAAGIGPSSPDSAWVNRFRNYITSIDTSYKVINLAVGGYTTYHAMPTGFVPPPGRPNPSVNKNVTFALTYNPVAILINLPSNDATNNYPMSEQISNYDTLVSVINANNVPLWISTTQPRNLSNQNQLDLLFAMRDSTYSRYGQYAVDFWTEIAQSNGWINPIYNSGDGIHLNNAAHRILFERMLTAVIPIIIPVELTSFSAIVNGNVITLNWVTATELNNYIFEIERSINKTDWRVIGFKEGNGTTTEIQNYSFIDDLYGTGSPKFYYRLKQIDFDGSFEYSNVVEVEAAPSAYSLSQNYPNPFNPTTNIGFQIAEFGFVSLKVYDVLGNEVVVLLNNEVEAGIHSLNFNASNLSSGVYYYTITAGNFTNTKKLILMK